MSRSNPVEHLPNPANRFFEWDGSTGQVRYFLKPTPEQKQRGEKGQNIVVKGPFTFLVLDELSTIKGWHEQSGSGIFSNEVRDTRGEILVVKAFEGGVIAEGLYSAIRDRVIAAGGVFTTNIYIGYKDGKDSPLKLGAIQFKGAALGAWMEFRKANRKAIGEQAVTITGSKAGKKGKIEFHTPTFAIKEIQPATDEAAKQLDAQALQPYLEAYFKRTRVAQASSAKDQHPGPDEVDRSNPADEPLPTEPPGDAEPAPGPEEDDVSF